MARTKCTVEKVSCTPFITTEARPFEFLMDAIILVWVTRTFTDGRKEKALLTIKIRKGYRTDGASTFWPFSKAVPQWIHGDDSYNAAPVVHDVLYMMGGVVEGELEPVKLSREEVDDILRGIWRCWGMSRFVAGCADKAVELFAGGKSHWGSDSLEVRDKVSATWKEEK